MRGVRPEDLKAREIVADNIVRGSLDQFAGTDAVAIGDRLARQLGLTVGDKLTIVAPRPGADFFDFPVRVEAFLPGDPDHHRIDNPLKHDQLLRRYRAQKF